MIPPNPGEARYRRILNRRTLLVVACAVISTLGFAVAGWQFSGGRSDQLAPWIEAMATVVALAAATGAALYAASAFDIENRREGRWLTDKKRSQAEQVSIWTQSYHYGYFLRNGSNAPIYNVTIAAHATNTGVSPEYVHWPADVVLPPTEGPTEITRVTTKHRALMTGLVDAAVARGRSADEVGVLMAVDFNDASGQRWHRDPYGTLTPIENHGQKDYVPWTVVDWTDE